jgi:hypothetical protein
MLLSCALGLVCQLGLPAFRLNELEHKNTLGVVPTHSADMDRCSDIYPLVSYTVIKFVQLGGHQCRSANMNIPRRSLEKA